jgi:hypothetical protein
LDREGTSEVVDAIDSRILSLFLLIFRGGWEILIGPVCESEQLSSVDASLPLSELLISFLVWEDGFDLNQQHISKIFFRTLRVKMTNSTALTAPCPESPIP